MFTHHHKNFTACKSLLYFYSTIVIIDYRTFVNLQSYWQPKLPVSHCKFYSNFLQCRDGSRFSNIRLVQFIHRISNRLCDYICLNIPHVFGAEAVVMRKQR